MGDSIFDHYVVYYTVEAVVKSGGCCFLPSDDGALSMVLCHRALGGGYDLFTGLELANVCGGVCRAALYGAGHHSLVPIIALGFNFQSLDAKKAKTPLEGVTSVGVCHCGTGLWPFHLVDSFRLWRGNDLQSDYSSVVVFTLSLYYKPPICSGGLNNAHKVSLT